MGGFLGIGGSSEKTDRANQLQAVTDMKSIYNWGLPEGKSQVAQGKAATQTAEDFYKQLMTQGRTGTAEMSASSVNAAREQADASKKEAGTRGTARSGGTAGAERESGQKTESSIDKIINENMMGGKMAGAQGMERVGKQQTSTGLNLVNMSENIVSQIMENATQSRGQSNQIASQAGESYGQLAAMLLFGL